MRLLGNQFIVIIAICILLCSCRIISAPEMPEKKVIAVMIKHFNDSACNDYCSRIIFTNVSCAERQYYSRNGKAIPKAENKPENDSLCYTCSDMEDERSVLMNPIWDKPGYAYSIHLSKARISMENPHCNKDGFYLKDKFGDSTPIVLWSIFNSKKETLVIYMARDTCVYPYYVANSLDSLVYDLNKICNEEELAQERNDRQSLVEKYCKVDVTPNPFTDNFEITLKTKYPIILDIKPGDLIIKFMDANGNILLTQKLEVNTPTTFSFPDVKSNSIVFYTITGTDFTLNGQVLKSP